MKKPTKIVSEILAESNSPANVGPGSRALMAVKLEDILVPFASRRRVHKVRFSSITVTLKAGPQQ
jgi:hypothetical protein